MLHWYASETLAAIVWVAFFLLAAASAMLMPQWWASLSVREMLIGLGSCCCAARLVASGKRCEWPRGVDFTGRVALVTGASSGVGFACSEELASHGFTVIMAGPDLDRLLVARQKIMKKLAAAQKPRVAQSAGKGEEPAWSAGGGGRVVVLGKVDLSDEDSIREYAATVTAAAKHYPVALLINAAAILNRELRYASTNWPGGTTRHSSLATRLSPANKPRAPKAAPTKPLEQMLAINAVGPMLLTQLLLPVLVETATKSGVTSRIVNVASSCHSFLGPALSSTAFDPIQMIMGLEKRAPGRETKEREEVREDMPASTTRSATAEPQGCVERFTWSNFVGYYGLSKLCVIWNTRLLARQVAAATFNADGAAGTSAKPTTGARGEQKVFVACTHPGVITTHLYRDLFPLWVLDHVIYWPSLLVGKTWREAAQSTLKAAVEGDADRLVQGGYYMDGGEYGEQSGVNCLSSHASNVQMMMTYGEWLKEKIVDITPRHHTAVTAMALSDVVTPATNKQEI